MFKCRISLLIILFVVSSFPLIKAQDAPIKWGVIPVSDLKMKSFPDDTNATAVILCDYGDSFVNNEIDLEFHRHVRVKILNNKGFDWGEFSITIVTEDGLQRISDIEGATYNLDDNGEVIKSELDKDDIFEDEVDDRRTRYRFTLPNLKPGCVIEVRYKIKSTSLFYVNDWTFQHSEPTLWSEYRLAFPGNIAYSVVYQGYEPWYYRNTETIRKYCSGTLANIFNNNFVDFNQYHYIVRNAPALRNEPYITTIDDYYNKVDVQLAGYVFPGTGKKEFLRDWESLVNELLDNEYFYEEIDVTGDVEDLADEITKGLTTPEEKLRAIYTWVSKSIVWTGKKRILADQDVDDLIESKKGNSAEMSFLLLSLLKSVGINGDPLILSTRDNGRLQQLYPITSQFNYCIARVILNGKTFYLDPTDPYRPIGVLPVRILGVKALVIKEGPVEWIDLDASKPTVNNTLEIVNVKEDGSINGIIEDRFGEYNSLAAREALGSKTDLEVAKSYLDTEPEVITVDSVMITGKDSLESPLMIKGWISSSVYAQKSGNMIYLNPFMSMRIRENPFKSKIRKFPVDFGFRTSAKIVQNITIPNGYELKEPLKDKRFFVGNSALFIRNAAVKGNFIQILTEMEIKEARISSDDYSALKNFYAQVVSSESEQLVIGPVDKSTKTPEPGGGNSDTQTGGR